ncbi:hypothetical protein SAMN05421788_103201 [Filimonas lacunae]|uniref:Uncharacterized protein n=1 Tax=Filimonas lacunae TaxID=477680 RepID=A0A1N7P506_9BACT|nr:hypothetical protein [Filimonas lacunae]SIT05683.1 hypothetical protein SAMN05421788_103201 [Filimonas lacunae]
MKWTDIALRILKGERNISSPFDETSIIEYRFIIHDTQSRLGYLQLWCPTAKKGYIFTGRLAAPDNEPNVVLTTDIDQLPDDIAWQSSIFCK